MKILFYTHLTGDDTVGLSYSVPNRIAALEKIDDVLWINSTDAQLDNWKDVKCFHKLSEFGKRMNLDILPAEFKKPDVVIFEDFYYIDQVRFSYILVSHKIPYVIVPRSNLTYSAQHNKSGWKKRIFNFLIFRRYARNACCIQYLTHNELRTSSTRWNSRNIVVPNGFNIPSKTKDHFSSEGTNAVYIGRMSAYHKGLDLLVSACISLKNELRNSGFRLKLYGKDEDDFGRIKEMVLKAGIDDFVSFPGPVVGKEKEEALLNADLFVQVSRLEGMPMGVLEAFAYGLPVLISEGTNLTEEVMAYRAGWCCSNSEDSIKKAFMDAINNRQLYPEYGKNAQALAKNYNWDEIAKKFHEEISLVI